MRSPHPRGVPRRLFPADEVPQFLEVRRPLRQPGRCSRRVPQSQPDALVRRALGMYSAQKRPIRRVP